MNPPAKQGEATEDVLTGLQAPEPGLASCTPCPPQPLGAPRRGGGRAARRWGPDGAYAKDQPQAPGTLPTVKAHPPHPKARPGWEVPASEAL